MIDRIGDASQFSPLLLPLVVSHACFKERRGALHSPPFVHFATGASGYIWCGALGWAFYPPHAPIYALLAPLVIPPLKERVWKFPCVQHSSWYL